MPMKPDEHPLDFIKSKLEPDTFQCVMAVKGGDSAAWMSIAISLKRIADAMETDRLNESIGNAIFNGILNAAPHLRGDR